MRAAVNYIVLLFVLFISEAIGQNTALVKDIVLSKFGNNLEISYTVVSDKKAQGYFPSVEIKYESGRSVTAKTFESIPEKTVVFDGENKIIWRADKDGAVINDMIYTVVILSKDVQIPLAPHIIKTAIFPGWGNYRLGNSNFYFTYGLVGWGLMGGSVLLNHSAAENYDNYKNTLDTDIGNEYFNKAQTQNKLSYVCFGLGTAIWVANLAGVIVKKNKVEKDIRKETSEYYYELSQQKICAQSRNFFFDNRPEWKIAMDNGDYKFRNKQFTDAKTQYEKALSLNPNSEEITARIKETDNELEKIRKAEEEYNKAVATADSLYKVNEFTNAINYYLAAQTIHPENKYPKQQIESCNAHIEEIRKQNDYNGYIEKADQYFKQKQYDDAIENYKQALKIFPDKEYPETQLTKIKEITDDIEFKSLLSDGKTEMRNGNYGNARYYFKSALDIKPNNSEAFNLFAQAEAKMKEQEKARVDKEYSDYITYADAAFKNKEYDKAKEYYQKALKTKPELEYPKTKIQQIEELYKKPDNFSESLPDLNEKNRKAVFFVYASNRWESIQGSGFFVSKDGIAISNYHVFEDMDINLSVIKTYDDKEYKIEKVLEKNQDNDYVIFKVKKTYTSEVFNYLTIAETLPKVGEQVFAIGNPEGLDQTLSTGIVSGYRMEKQYIQTTTPITHGSSGGPLCNSKGEVIGITTMGQQEGSLFFSVSIKEIPLSKYK